MRDLRQIFPLLLFALLAAACAKTAPPPYQLRGNWHAVADGDTLESLSQRYKVDVAAIKELNDLADDRALRARREVFIPRKAGKRPGDGPKPRPVPSSPADRTEPSGRSGAATGGRCGEEGRPCLLWPAEGTLITRYNQKGDAPHDGIDIKAAKGAPVSAAADGEVIYSGDQIKGYGNLVILRHDGGLITVYAHNLENLVKEGDKVIRGQNIATVGDSGVAEVPHLHFEVRDGEQPMDPTGYLPE